MRPAVELSHLKYFYFTALEGGVQPAADRLCVQQPVVSKMIKSLENQFGQALFKREGRRNALTDFGQLVFRHCQTIFDEVDKVSQLEAKPGALTGTLNLGAAEPIAVGLLPEVLEKFGAEYPRVHCNVYTSTAAQLVEMISNGKLDAGLFFHIPGLPPNLEVIQTLPVRFHLVIKRELKDDEETIQSFIGSREIDDLSTHKFPTVERMRKTWPKTRITFSSNHLGLHRELVLRGRGVSILPAFLVEEDLRAKRLADLYPRETFMFQLKAVARKGAKPSLFVQKLLTFLKAI